MTSLYLEMLRYYELHKCKKCKGTGIVGIKFMNHFPCGICKGSGFDPNTVPNFNPKVTIKFSDGQFMETTWEASINP